MEILNSILKDMKEDAPVQEARRGLHWTAVVSEGASFMQLKKKGGVRFVSIIKDYDVIVRRLAG